MTAIKRGILLANIGTPDEPTVPAVRRYLREFLSDRRVVSLPPILWQPILRGIILRTRPKQSAALYQKIWTTQGSPLLLHSQALAQHLKTYLTQQSHTDIAVEIGMRYGNPSIASALKKLREQDITQLYVLPLYPQYSTTSTESCFDIVKAEHQQWQNKPELYLIPHYADQEDYTNAIANSIQRHWQTHDKGHLLFSFHGIPQKYVKNGDPYRDLCEVTVQQITQHLALTHNEWTLSFQSRIGPTQWLSPYTDKTLQALASQGVDHVQVVCPGFAVDCLETLEEIAIRGKEQFFASGGKKFEYISALNSSLQHVEVLAQILLEQFN